MFPIIKTFKLRDLHLLLYDTEIDCMSSYIQSKVPNYATLLQYVLKKINEWKYFSFQYAQILRKISQLHTLLFLV